MPNSTERKKRPGMGTSGIVPLILAAACGTHPVPAAPGPTSPGALALAPLPAPVEARATPPSPVYVHVDAATFCIIRDGRMEMVEIDGRDSTYQGQPIARAFPLDSTFATNASWYRSGEVLWFPASHYMKY